MNGDIATWDAHWQKLSAGQKSLTKNPTHRNYFNMLRKAIGTIHECRTLELGAGRATVSWFIAQNGGIPTALDTSETAKKLAVANYKATHTGPLVYLTGDAAATGLTAFSFDAVFSVGLLEHFADPLPVMNESLRLTRGLAWHLVIGKTKGNDAFYRNDLGPSWYVEQGWDIETTDEEHVFVVRKTVR